MRYNNQLLDYNFILKTFNRFIFSVMRLTLSSYVTMYMVYRRFKFMFVQNAFVVEGGGGG